MAPLTPFPENPTISQTKEWLKDLPGEVETAVGEVSLTPGPQGVPGESGVFVPDFANRAPVLATDGTWTAAGSGFVQRAAHVNKPATAYAAFGITINGVTAWAREESGLLSTGIYDYTSPPLPIKAGDAVVTSSNGSSITSTLYFIPPRPVAIPEYEIDNTPTSNSQNLVTSGGVYGSVSAINAKIPVQASASNQLADKDFVNSSIENMSANRVRYNAANEDFPTYAAFQTAISTDAFWFQGQPYTPTKNDYAGIMADETQGGHYTRYAFDGELWGIQSVLNNTSFTSSQMDAINSGATAAIISQVGGNELAIAGHETRIETLEGASQGSTSRVYGLITNPGNVTSLATNLPTGLTTVLASNGVTCGGGKITILESGMYLVSKWLRYRGVSGSTGLQDQYSYVTVNGVDQESTYSMTTLDGVTVRPSQTHCTPLQLNSGDVVSLRSATDKSPATVTPYLEAGRARLGVFKLG